MIQLRNLTLRRGGAVVLDGVSFTIQPGEKVGLVGRNGAGKSTLFALLAGELHEDSGELLLPAHWRIAQVAQQLPDTDDDATDFVLAGDVPLTALRQALAQAEDRGDGLAIAQLHADLHDAGAHDALPRAQALLLGLGFAAADLRRPVRTFSGGWRMRLALARALMCPSDLLLLDEPTNHLDLDALVWLESWLQRYAGTLVVISHDREFLDAVTRVTLHVQQGRVTRYGAGYSGFELLRAQQLALQQAAWARQQQQVARMQRFIERFRAKATKARQAQSRAKALERLERVAPVLADAEFDFAFRPSDALPDPMLTLRDAVCGYPAALDADRGGQPGGSVILRGITREVRAGQRIGILGANGHGKSTLVKTIAGALALQGGRMNAGKGLAIGYFAQQEMDLLRADESPLQHLTRLARQLAQPGQTLRESDLRAFLGGFLFAGEMALRPVGTMSGGERARLVLALLVWQRPNLLLLDEPTNHLDLATREALAVALNDFEGTVLLVSHDRALLRAVCDSFWLVADGTVQDWDGDLDDYQRWLLEDARRRRDALRAPTLDGPAAERGAPVAGQTATAAGARSDPSTLPSPAAAVSRDDRRRDAARERQARAQRLRPLQTELQGVTARRGALDREREQLETGLAGPLAADTRADYGRRLKQLSDEYAALEERWLELTVQIESAA